MSLPCGTNLDFSSLTDATADLKSEILSKLGGSGTFTSASDLKSAVDSKINTLTSGISGLLPEIPELPALSLQGELTSLAAIDLTNPLGILDYQSKLASITENFGGALSASGFNLDSIVSQVAPAASSATDALSGVTDSLSGVTDAASGALSSATDALSSVTDAASGALSSATDALSGVASGGDICELCPNFDLQAGATEAIQKAQNPKLSSIAAIKEEFTEFTANVDFNAQFDEMTTKANKILADPDVQAKISSDIASAQEQISADIEGGITDVTEAAQPIIKEVAPVLEELSGKSLSVKIPKNINIPKNLFRK